MIRTTYNIVCALPPWVFSQRSGRTNSCVSRMPHVVPPIDFTIHPSSIITSTSPEPNMSRRRLQYIPDRLLLTRLIQRFNIIIIIIHNHVSYCGFKCIRIHACTLKVFMKIGISRHTIAYHASSASLKRPINHRMSYGPLLLWGVTLHAWYVFLTVHSMCKCVPRLSNATCSIGVCAHTMPWPLVRTTNASHTSVIYLLYVSPPYYFVTDVHTCILLLY